MTTHKAVGTLPKTIESQELLKAVASELASEDKDKNLEELLKAQAELEAKETNEDDPK